MIYCYYKHLFFKKNLVVDLNIIFWTFFANKEVKLNKVSHHLRTSALAFKSNSEKGQLHYELSL